MSTKALIVDDSASDRLGIKNHLREEQQQDEEAFAPINLQNDQLINNICSQEINQRKAIVEALIESERSKSVFLSHLPGLAYRCNYDEHWTMQNVSKGSFDLTGYPPESLLYNRDLSYNDLISPEYREAVRNEWERVLKARQMFKYEYEIITATGERKWVLETGQGIYNDDGEVEALEGIILDISERKEIENALKYNSEHDRWTGLYNRDYLVSLLEKDIRLKKNIKKALIGINLNMVQILTANHGFQYSQNLIKKAAEALRQYCNENRLLSQPRENRFIFYIYDYKDKNEIFDLCGIIIKTLESLFVTEIIGGGIGVLEINQNLNGVDVDSILRRLLIASERFVGSFGKDFKICIYDEELEALVNREREIMEVLNAIVENDHINGHTKDDLFLQYQPILSLKTGCIFGFEALSRLKTEKFGLVSPLEFIPIAEKTKLILPLGEKVIVKAFDFLNQLKAHGYNKISVSINISIIQLLKPDFTNRFYELMREMRINPPLC
ncbi:MAG: EAL domain-containing protein [Anaerovoracaceae bacterium]